MCPVTTSDGALWVVAGGFRGKGGHNVEDVGYAGRMIREGRIIREWLGMEGPGCPVKVDIYLLLPLPAANEVLSGIRFACARGMTRGHQDVTAVLARWWLSAEAVSVRKSVAENPCGCSWERSCWTA
jgi:hypothetical protein